LAATSLSQEAIKQFADHYGPLGLSARDGAVPLALKIASGAVPSTTGAEKRPLGTGELLSSWHEQIRAIRDATTLWSAIQGAAAGDSHQLIRHIKWLREDFVYYNSHPDYPLPRASLRLGIPPDTKASSFHQDPEIGDLRTLVSSLCPRRFRAGALHPSKFSGIAEVVNGNKPMNWLMLSPSGAIQNSLGAFG
jgi:hypothetical protein